MEPTLLLLPCTVWPLAETIGETILTYLQRDLMASASLTVSVCVLSEPMFTPPLCWSARITIIMLVPMVDTWLLMFFCELCPRLTIAITDEMPITTPSMVSSVRVLLRMMELYAIFSRLHMFMFANYFNSRQMRAVTQVRPGPISCQQDNPSPHARRAALPPVW